MPTYPVKHKETGEQKEHMELVENVRKVFKEQFPTVSEALGWV